jgi:hypothetical protein
VRLDPEDLRHMLKTRFCGDSTYMPLHLTGTPVPRAAAQLFPDKNIPPMVISHAPVSTASALERKHESPLREWLKTTGAGAR